MPFTPDEARRVLESADVVCSARDISRAVARLASEISVALADASPLVLCVMRGSIVFAGHILPLLRFPLDLDYLDLTRYGDGTRGGAIEWNVFPRQPVSGRVVLVLDDILDEGHTLAAIRDRLAASGARRVLSAVLAVKDIARARQASPDFVGVTLPDRYVFGYGMDVRGAWRNLPDIYAVREEP